ncbi:hypothetical protein COY28_02600, partial [Candidatus Woesearchaeota archaeon CG_4_10_14_0_2_um_filter_57_5]
MTANDSAASSEKEQKEADSSPVISSAKDGAIAGIAQYDVAIIGGGVAGYSAGMYAGRFGLKTILFAEKIGGTIMLKDEIANYPGFSMISGYDLAEKIRQHALEYGLKEVPARVAAVERKGSCFRLRSGKDGKDMVQA